MLRNVVFLVSDGVPDATGFFVGVGEVEENILIPYVVTARHCVEQTAGRQFFIRINAADGRYRDEPTAMDDWWIHDSEDVAVIRFGGAPVSSTYDLKLEYVDKFIQADYHFDIRHAVADLAESEPGFSGVLSGRWTQKGFEDIDRVRVQVGDELFFVSLLYEQPGESCNLPIARFGHISRMPEEPILIQRTGGTIVPLTAYLAECHSWGGHSGSPVYWTHPMVKVRSGIPDPDDPSQTIQVPELASVSALLGLVSGHWTIDQLAKTQGDILGSIRTAINSGIAVVTPAAAIRDLLMRDDVLEDRKKVAKKRRKELDARRAITPDAGKEDG